jgi:hypothetical protein
VSDLSHLLPIVFDSSCSLELFSHPLAATYAATTTDSTFTIDIASLSPLHVISSAFFTNNKDQKKARKNHLREAFYWT